MSYGVNQKRRQALRAGLGVGVLGVLIAAGVVRPEQAFAAQRALFDTTSLAETLDALDLDSRPESSDEIVLTLPDVADNGAQVPVEIESRLPDTDTVLILVERNPNMVAARFELHEGMLPQLQTYIKMNETSDVFALVRSQGKYFMTRRHVQVTLGGCG